jgi:hypothetical protein
LKTIEVLKHRILFQLNELSYSGTTKAVLTFCQHLNREVFDVYLFCKAKPKNLRYYRHKLEAKFSKKARFRFEEFYLISRAREPEFIKTIGRDHLQFGDWSDFQHFIKKIQPDVVHFFRGEEQD